ncbi:class I SAM-dependent methyltransferase [Leptolyngbya sp. FACHB-17]|uniref:class I SAM-dependent methyltransferase n=1 Tax=unclassified Leptolyngbya TaxID=2650499 RepID=UPI001F559B68|nr:class I SAM-dependent methyltransferase [Leptolyngbya sp. FACHB-17]
MTSSDSSTPIVDQMPTGERHIPVQAGEDTSLANVDHMIRYAMVAPFVRGKRVLDISCGTGYGTQFIALQGAREVIGVDVDQASIDFASKYYQHPQVTYLQSDAHYVQSLEDASFDLIVSFETIEHLPHPRQFLAEVRRLLKPDGQLFLSCPNDHRVSPWISPYHLHRFRFNEFRDLFLSLFGEAVFFGQHYIVASCLVKPIAPQSKVSQFDAYQNSLPDGFFGQHYLEHLSSIEQADGYLAVVGVDESELTNQISLSQSAFQSLLKSVFHAQGAGVQQQHDRLQVQHLQAQLNQAQQTVQLAQTRIQAMESSKFWQLRKGWFGIKRKLGLPVNE